MPKRIISKIVKFEASFVIGEFTEILPAGFYLVDTEEELILGISFRTYLPVLTTIHLRSKSGNVLPSRSLNVDPNDLAVALIRDGALPVLLVHVY